MPDAPAATSLPPHAALPPANPTWDGALPPPRPPLSLRDRLRVARRGAAILLVLALGLGCLLSLRLIERPLFGSARPLTPNITRVVCRMVLRIMGLRLDVRGPRLGAVRGAIVANHTSWLDIFVLNSRKNVYFVSKAEVAGWPGIGLLARATGTLFITRDRRHAARQTAQFQERLLHGHRLLFFPEGTSTDGQRVLPFKTTLFAAFFDAALVHRLKLQAASLVYHAPEGEPAYFYGWWGDMDFGPSLLQVLAQRRQGRVVLKYHPAVRVDAFPNRKSLAQHLETQVREGHKDLRAKG